MSRYKISNFKLTCTQRNALDKQRKERQKKIEASWYIIWVFSAVIGGFVGVTIELIIGYIKLLSIPLHDNSRAIYTDLIQDLSFCCFILGALLFGILFMLFWEIVEEKYLDKLERKEIRKLIKERRQISRRIEIENKSIVKEIARLEELRQSNLNSDKVRSINRLLSLMRNVTDDKQLKDMANIINDKMAIVLEISKIESKVKALSDEYKKIGDEEKAIYYLKYINTEET